MTASAPSVLLYAQALSMLQDLQSHYEQGILQTPDELSSELRDILTRFEEGAGHPFLQYEPVAEGEPPLSAKMNRTWVNLQQDINILQEEVDVLQASGVFIHNFITTEIQKIVLEVARANNKLKTLQLYSASTDANVITFGDSFASGDFMDTAFSQGLNAPQIQDGILALGQLGQVVNLTQRAKVTIMDNSNGFSGDNQEIDDPNAATADPVTGDKQYVFLAETDRHADLKTIIDNEPNSWFEYENYLVNSADRLSASNLNFVYFEVTSPVAVSGSNAVTAENTTVNVDWAQGPTDGKLELTLQFDLGSNQKINYISFVPFGLRDNSNFPVLIKQVRISPDGTDWKVITPQNVWVGTSVNIPAARTADNVVVGTAVWSFPNEMAQFIQVDFEQSQPVQCNIGHLYYLDRTNGNRTPGPIPPITNPTLYDAPDSVSTGDLIQKREYFVGKRWAIGIRDFLAEQIQYQTESVMVTHPLRVAGLVDRVVLNAEVFVPTEFPSDQVWVKFFVSPDNGSNWYQISRIQDDFLDIPEEIAFNDPTPVAFQESGVAYYNTTNPVTQLRLKIELDRPTTTPSSTPYVRSYLLKVKTK